MIALLLISGAGAHRAAETAFWSRVEPVVAEARSERLRDFAAAHWARLSGAAAPAAAQAAALQRADVLYPGLEARPWHDAREFAWSGAVEGAAAVVERELDAALLRPAAGDWRSTSTRLLEGDTSAFARLVLRDDRGPTAAGRDSFPGTLAALGGVPLAPRPVAVNRQGPRSGLGEHTDNMNFVLTAHLGLRGCGAATRFVVGGRRRSWTTGALLVADTSFLHSTANDSRRARYVLSFAVWHPDLSLRERRGILRLHDALRGFEAAA